MFETLGKKLAATILYYTVAQKYNFTHIKIYQKISLHTGGSIQKNIFKSPFKNMGELANQ